MFPVKELLLKELTTSVVQGLHSLEVVRVWRMTQLLPLRDELVNNKTPLARLGEWRPTKGQLGVTTRWWSAYYFNLAHIVCAVRVAGQQDGQAGSRFSASEKVIEDK